jgi:hypothetical protein
VDEDDVGQHPFFLLTGCWNFRQAHIRAKSVGRLHPELHLTLFPQLTVSEWFARKLKKNHMKTTMKFIYSGFTSFALACFALSPTVRAVVPAPDGGYPGGNTAEGQNALLSLSSGRYNTAVGFVSLGSNTTGGFNTAIGAAPLLFNTGDNNTANGALALLSNTTGGSNTANGAFALFSNTDGTGHTAVGYNALATATAGPSAFAANTAVGANALSGDTTGNGNTAVGAAALFGNTTGGGNTAIGNLAGSTLTTGHNNISVGAGGGVGITTGDSNIDIGSAGNSLDSGTIRIGTQGTQTATYIAGIYLTVLPITVPVGISVDGQLGEPQVSSARFKDDIKPMDDASEVILALKPVRFHYKREIDPSHTSQFGLVAEDVEKVNPDLIVRDKEGKPYTVRYDQVNAMLLNEFLKEHCMVQELKTTVAKQAEQIEALNAGLQKVSAELELNKPAPKTALNNQ